MAEVISVEPEVLAYFKERCLEAKEIEEHPERFEKVSYFDMMADCQVTYTRRIKQGENEK